MMNKDEEECNYDFIETFKMFDGHEDQKEQVASTSSKGDNNNSSRKRVGPDQEGASIDYIKCNIHWMYGWWTLPQQLEHWKLGRKGDYLLVARNMKIGCFKKVASCLNVDHSDVDNIVVELREYDKIEKGGNTVKGRTEMCDDDNKTFGDYEITKGEKDIRLFVNYKNYRDLWNIRQCVQNWKKLEVEDNHIDGVRYLFEKDWPHRVDIYGALVDEFLEFESEAWPFEKLYYIQLRKKSEYMDFYAGMVIKDVEKRALRYNRLKRTILENQQNGVVPDEEEERELRKLYFE